MGKMDVHFSSKSDDRGTPQALYDLLHREFHFTLDVCANKRNAKCKNYFSSRDNGLEQQWNPHTCWMNPPYSKIKDWMDKACREVDAGATVVCLIPARTDTRWWWAYVTDACEIRFLKGRLKFEGEGCDSSAPFPSAIVVLKPTKPGAGKKTQRKILGTSRVSWWDWRRDIATHEPPEAA